MLFSARDGETKRGADWFHYGSFSVDRHVFTAEGHTKCNAIANVDPDKLNTHSQSLPFILFASLEVLLTVFPFPFHFSVFKK